MTHAELQNQKDNAVAMQNLIIKERHRLKMQSYENMFLEWKDIKVKFEEAQKELASERELRIRIEADNEVYRRVQHELKATKEELAKYQEKERAAQFDDYVNQIRDVLNSDMDNINKIYEFRVILSYIDKGLPFSERKEETVASAIMDRIDEMPITKLKISGYTLSPLKREGVKTIGQIRKLGAEGLLKIHRFGLNGLTEVKEELKDLGITL